MKNVAVIAAILALIAALGFWQWQHTSNPATTTATPSTAAAPLTLKAYVAKAASNLPQPYADGFSLVRVNLDGTRLILDIRSTDIAMADIDPAKLPSIRDQEQKDLIAASCQDPTLLPAMHAGTVVVRRFFDRNGQPIFEVMAEQRHCGRMM